MKVTGIIAEYNPFHNGHAYHIEMAKKLTGADYVVVVMSGDFVQRGTPAMIPKHARARMALLNGADLVLELPVNYASATAESFAYGGVKILDGLGIVDHICFGSECGDVSLLTEIAEILVHEPKWYSCALKDYLQKGLSYPAARMAALPMYQSILTKPNNILGIEYSKALLRLKSAITPVTLNRQGAGYHDTVMDHTNELSTLSQNTFASASGIRQYLAACMTDSNAFHTLSEEDHRKIAAQIPVSAYPVLAEALKEYGFITEDDFSQILLYKLLRLQSPEELTDYLDLSEELANRIYKQRYEYKSFSQFASLLKTKEITRTGIDRALLHFILELKNDLPDEIYGRILGFRKESAMLLSEIKKCGRIPLISKSAAVDTILNKEQLLVFTKSADASNLYEGIAACKQERSILHEYQKQIVILP